MRTRTMIVLVAAVTGLLSTSCMATAAAGPPPGSETTCTPSFDVMTLPMILEQAQRNGILQERAQAMWDSVNKNGDDWICQKQLSGTNHYDFVDNQAVGYRR